MGGVELLVVAAVQIAVVVIEVVVVIVMDIGTLSPPLTIKQ